jgi:hypothetical protein
LLFNADHRLCVSDSCIYSLKYPIAAYSHRDSHPASTDADLYDGSNHYSDCHGSPDRHP